MPTAVIGVDVIFEKEKDKAGDSILAKALESIENDILVSTFNSEGKLNRSQQRFLTHAKAEGILQFKSIHGITSRFIPLPKINDSTHEEFAVKILRAWNPQLSYSLRPGQAIPIKFRRSLKRFFFTLMGH